MDELRRDQVVSQLKSKQRAPRSAFLKPRTSARAPLAMAKLKPGDPVAVAHRF
jgi:hypothetical protein